MCVCGGVLLLLEFWLTFRVRGLTNVGVVATAAVAHAAVVAISVVFRVFGGVAAVVVVVTDCY